MKDVDLAIEVLEKEDLTLVVVKDGKIVFSSNEKGIKPLYNAVKEHKKELKGSSVADKVTGRAAAMLCIYAGVKHIKTKLMSNNALKALKEADITYEYTVLSPFIKNRDRTGMCPIETLSLKSANTDELLMEIEKFLKGIKG